MTLRLGSFPAEYGRMLALAAFAGFFLSAAGAFDTEIASLGPRLSYWLIIASLSTAALEASYRGLSRALPGKPLWLVRAYVLALLFLPLGVAALLLCESMFGGGLSLARFGALLPGMTSILITLQLALAFSSSADRSPVGASDVPDVGKLAEALPLPMRSTALVAIHAQDHYVQVHTSAGQALVRMRFKDAVDAASGQPGYRPHRSWWVAADAVRSLRRQDGRLTMVLETGLQVPVSRNAARTLGPEFG